MTTSCLSRTEHFEDLAADIRVGLALHCRALSMEQCAIYATQIALAELNARAGGPDGSLELYTLGVTANASN